MRDKGANGKAIQNNILAFPSYKGKNGERNVSIFFHIAEGLQTSVIYLTSSIEVRAPFSLFLKKESFYRPIQNNRLDKNAGKLIPDIDPRFEFRSNDEERTRQLFKNEGFIKHLSELENYPAVQFGPDAVIISKPYEGVKDTNPESIALALDLLLDLAEAIESVK